MLKKYFVTGLFAAFLMSVSFSLSAGAAVSQKPAVITAKTISCDSGVLFEKINYPQVSGLADASAQSKINAILKQKATKSQLSSSDAAESNKYESHKWSSCLDYTVRYNKNGLLSVSFDLEQDTGGNHPDDSESAYTFDLNSGSVCALGSIMKSAAYRSAVSGIIVQQIKQRAALPNDNSQKLIPIGTFKSIDSNPEYYLSNTGIVFFFQEYRYFPFANGIPQFTVKYADIKKYISGSFSFLS